MSLSQLVIMTFVFEFAEIYLQYSTTLKESLLKQYSYYSKSPFLFYGTQVGYIWLLFLSIYYGNLTWPLIIAIVLKSFDIFTKLMLLEKLFIKPDASYIAQIESTLTMRLPFWAYLVGPLTYPYLVFLAFN